MGQLPQEASTQLLSSASCNSSDAESKGDKVVLQSTSSVLATHPFQQGLYKQAQQIYELEDVSR